MDMDDQFETLLDDVDMKEIAVVEPVEEPEPELDQ